MILAILQARMGSTRLPGKVMKEVVGKPLIEHEIARVNSSRKIDELVVATSTEVEDDILFEFCQDKDVACFRGSFDDVLDRYYQCAKKYQPSHVVRITGDCPLIDPEIIDQVIIEHIESKADYTSNTVTPTFPDGLDVEVMRFDVLQKVWKLASLPSQREHVTKYINDYKDDFKISEYVGVKDYSAFRWTVDTAADFKVVSYIFEELYPKKSKFSYQDILSLYSHDNSGTLSENAAGQRNEGLLKSIEADRKFTQG